MKNIAYKIMEFMAGAALIISAAIVVLNIVLGKVFGSPLKGTYEMVGLCCCIMASMAIPMGTLMGSHVAVDIVVQAMKPKWQMAFEFFARIVDVLVGCVLTFCTYRFAVGMFDVQETTQTLGIPVWPFRYLWMLGCILVVVFSVYSMVQIPKKYKGDVLSAADAEIEEAKQAAKDIYGLDGEKGGDEA